MSAILFLSCVCTVSLSLPLAVVTRLEVILFARNLNLCSEVGEVNGDSDDDVDASSESGRLHVCEQGSVPCVRTQSRHLLPSRLISRNLRHRKRIPTICYLFSYH